MSIPLQFAPLSDDQVFVWSDCLLNLGTDFLVGNMVLVRDAYYPAVAPHFHGLVEAVCITLKIQIRHSNSDVVILKSWEGLAHLNLLS